MKSKLLAAAAATVFTFVLSNIALAQTTDPKKTDASKKKIENITNYGAVQTSSGTAKGYTGTYTANPPKRKTDLQTSPPPSPATQKNPNGGWRGPTNNPSHVTPSTTTYHAPVSTATYHPAATPPARTVSTPPVRTVSAPPVRTVSTPPSRPATTTPPKKP